MQRFQIGTSAFVGGRHFCAVLPGLFKDVQDLLLVVAFVLDAAATGKNIAFTAPLGSGKFPDVVGKAAVNKVDAAAVVLFSIVVGHIFGGQICLDSFKSHDKSPFRFFFPVY